MMQLDKALVLIPAVCIVFAGLEKSAQFPFSSWLTGAMVAPTPVSALLHSSTMVKAGVYAILRMSPMMKDTAAANMLMYMGGMTFLVTALIAISQSNGKKVLAYSTIGNLGLIVACAGVSSPAALWSALLLIIFHAVSKPLLFLCVGVCEYKLNSRDIEDMDYLIMRVPKLAFSAMPPVTEATVSMPRSKTDRGLVAPWTETSICAQLRRTSTVVSNAAPAPPSSAGTQPVATAPSSSSKR